MKSRALILLFAFLAAGPWLRAQSGFLTVDHFWSPWQYSKSLGALEPHECMVREFCIRNPDEIWVVGRFRISDEEFRDAVFRVKLPNYETETFPIPDVSGYYANSSYFDVGKLRVSDDFVFVATRKGPQMKYDRKSGKWGAIPQVKDIQDACIAGDSVYLMSGRAAVLRLNLQTDAVKTVADTFRDPRESPLDDPKYTSLRLVGSANGHMWISGFTAGTPSTSQRYDFDPAANTWTPRSPTDRSVNPSSGFLTDQRLRGKCHFDVGPTERAALNGHVASGFPAQMAGDPVTYGYAQTPLGVLILGMNQSWPGFWFVPDATITNFLSGR